MLNRSRIALVSALIASLMAVLALAACTAPASSSSASSSASASTASSASASTSSSASSANAASADVVSIPLRYNAGTGYEWTCVVEPDGVIEQIGHETKDLSQDQATTGGPLCDYFTFKAVAAGEAVVTCKLARSWESGQAAETQVYAFTVTSDLKIILNPYKSDFDEQPEWVNGTQ